jgi:hypothetical protein
MTPVDFAFVKAIVAAVVVAGTSLSLYSLRLRYRSRGSAELERDVGELLEHEASQQADLESRLAELDERLDFAERRLAPPRPDLPVTTPV